MIIKSTSICSRNYPGRSATTSLNSSKKINVSFGTSYEWQWNHKKLRILERSSAEMEDLAEHLHLMNDYELEHASCGSLWEGILSSDKSQIRYKKLKDAVEKVKSHKRYLLSEVNKLETQKLRGISNVVDQKNRVNREFISLLPSETEGKTPPIPNGILIYGTSQEKDKFIDWLTESSGTIVKRFPHDKNNPMKTIENIVKTAEDSKAAFPHSKTRTILIIDNLDDMLTDQNTSQGIKIIGRFKGFVEHISKDCHTTIVAQTDKPLDDFEPASIASSRFNLKVDLKDGVSEDDLDRLDRYNREIRRLNNKADKDVVNEKFKNFVEINTSVYDHLRY